MSDEKLARPSEGDLVLREIWRAKEALSSAYGHDLDRLFAETKAKEKRFTGKVVDLSRSAKSAARPGKHGSGTNACLPRSALRIRSGNRRAILRIFG
jgi:hypothetical protein